MSAGNKIWSPESAPENFLEECRGWQQALTGVTDPLMSDGIGHQACLSLNGKANYYGSKRIIIRAQGAFVFSIVKAKSETRTKGFQFPEVTAKGSLGNVQYSRFGEAGVLSLPIYSAQLLRSSEVTADEIFEMLDDDPHALETSLPGDRPLRLPLHFPISLVEFALCASNEEPYRPSERIAEAAFEREVAELLEQYPDS